jgi:hypothetical protein
MYAFVAGAVGGAILPQIVRVHIETLLPLTLYDDAKLVSASLDLMQLEFLQKENLIRALSEIQARPHGLARMRTMSAYSCAMLYCLGLVLCSGRLTTSVFNVARIPGTATVRWRYAHRRVQWIASSADRAVYRALSLLVPQLRLRVERSEIWINGTSLSQESSDVMYMIGVLTDMMVLG